MSYIEKIKWEIVPVTMPVVIKSCSKCGNNSVFENSYKFRINGNKNSVDIWLIYKCSKCKSTWNMSIYRRIKPTEIDTELYQLFMNNDYNLAKQYGFDTSIHLKNNVKLNMDDIEYNVIGKDIDILKYELDQNKKISIEIESKYSLFLRADKIISRKLNISRQKVRKLIKDSVITCDESSNLLKQKINDGLTIYINGVH